MATSIVIRDAVKKDLPSIYELVRELAIFEEAEHELKIGIDDYEKEFENGTFQALVAEENGVILGTCIYYSSYSTWKGKSIYLEDFVVKEAYRKKGIGQQLFDHLIQKSKDLGAKLLRWQVLDWNQPGLNFYAKNNAIIEKEWWNGKIIF